MSLEKFEKIESAITLAQELGVTNEQLMEFLAAKMEELSKKSKVFEDVGVAGEKNEVELTEIKNVAEEEMEKLVSLEGLEKETSVEDFEGFKVYVKGLEDEAETNLLAEKQRLSKEITQRNLDSENEKIVPYDQYDEYKKNTKQKIDELLALNNNGKQYDENPLLIISTVVERYFKNSDFSNKRFMVDAVSLFGRETNQPGKVADADNYKVEKGKDGVMKKVFKKIAEEFRNKGLISDDVYEGVVDYLNNKDL